MGKTKIKEKKKRTQPVKICPKCKTKNAPSAKICKSSECEHQFFTKRNKVIAKNSLVEWKTLKKGDKIQLFSNDYFTDKKGQAVDIGNTGKYIVMKVDETGLLLYGGHGYCYQNMIKAGVSKAGFNVAPPRLIMQKSIREIKTK